MPDATATAIIRRRRRIGGMGWLYAKHAPNAAFYAAHDTTDCTADYGPDGTSGLATHVSAVYRPIGNALCLRRERACERYDDHGSPYDMEFHVRPFPTAKIASRGSQIWR